MDGLKVKHTDGPWWVRGTVVIGDGYELADCGVSLKPMDESIANALLIASAPELLEACKRALPWMGKLIASRVHEDCVMPNDAVRTMEMLEAYIAKAEGRS